MSETIIPDQWHGCYDASWKGIISQESFAHPAKIARGLVQRIYKHAFAQGWLAPGQVCCDPFGGIGGTAFHACQMGVRWLGCELEERFCGFAKDNFDSWEKEYAYLGKKFVKPVMVHGDSRKLCELLCGADSIISSPPFSGTEQPCASQSLGLKDYHAFTRGDGTKRDAAMTSGDGQLGSLKEGDIEAVLGSPPFSGSLSRDKVDAADRVRLSRESGGTNAEHVSPIDMEKIGKRSQGDYGAADGQLGRMREGEIADALVSSPPYEESPIASGSNFLSEKCPGSKSAKDCRADGYSPVDSIVSSPPYEASMNTTEDHEKRAERTDGFSQGMEDTKYGQNPFTFLSKDPSGLSNQERHDLAASNPQVGALKGQTFWEASKIIVGECHRILKPQGVAIWVVKNFVRKGKEVDFTGNWQRLCESLGFETIEIHQAMLVKHLETQKELFQEVAPKTRSRKSFFRRLCEAKGSPKIDHETVLVMRKLP